MIRVLFVCHGNICRSPMAEFVFKDMINKKQLQSDFYIASAATSTEEIWNGIGNPVYPPAQRELAKHGISCEGKRAVLRSTEENFLKRSDILTKNILHIWKIRISDTVQGSTATRTGMRQRRSFTMWEAARADPGIIISRPDILQETTFI